MSSNKNRDFNNQNLSPGSLSVIPKDSGNHCYVNLNQTRTGERIPSYNDSNQSSVKNLAIKPLTINNVNKLSPANDNFNKPTNPNSKTPKNWYSPPSSVQSDSRPPSMAGLKPHTHKGLSKLQTIDENSTMLSIDKVITLCTNKNVEIQLNALAYLQHLIFNNNEKKMEVRNCQGLRIIIELTRSDVANAALSVLKNMSFSEMEMITTDIERLGGIQRMISIIKNSNDTSQKELAIDVLWNLSVQYNLKNIILTETVKTIMECVILPECKLVKQPGGNYVPSEDNINWSIILKNSLGIIRNISYESTEARIKLREEDLLIDCILYLISMAKSIPETEDDIEQVSLIDSKIIENCVCILRNLTYAIQEVLDPNYLESRKSSSPKPKVSTKGKVNKQIIISPPMNDNPKGIELLWNSKYVVETLISILKFGANAVTLEAAAGIIQNLSAGDWEPSKELQTQFRLQLALPSMVELIDIAPDEVIRSAATALRNLVREENTCMLIGSNGLHILTEKIPMHMKSKKISNVSLAAVLSTIYAVIKNQDEFMKEFILEKGTQRCIYVRDSEEFINSEDQYPDKVPQFCKHILELLWKTPAARELLKKKKYKQSDLMKTRNLDPCNLCTPSKSTKSRHINDDVDTQNSNDMSSNNQSLSHYQEDNKYVRDSCSTMVSNAALQQRNSRAFTTNTIPGYGQVKVPVNYKTKNNRPNEIPRSNNKLYTINTASEKSDNQFKAQPYNYDDYNSKQRNYTGQQNKYSPGPRKAGSHNSYSNNSYVGSQDDISNHVPNKHIKQTYNRPSPNIPGQRDSEFSNLSDVYQHEYSIPNKSYKSPKVMEKREKGDSWV